MAKVMIMDTILRDAHQSQAATRMRTGRDAARAAKCWIRSAIMSLECWGGATFDTCLRFLQRGSLGAPAQAAARPCPTPSCRCCCAGQNILGYKHYADDVVDAFVKAVHRKRHRHHPHLRRAERSPATWKLPSRPPRSTAASAKLAMSYTTSPVHTAEYFVNLAMELEKMGADTICIKDMANLLLPYDGL